MATILQSLRYPALPLGSVVVLGGYGTLSSLRGPGVEVPEAMIERLETARTHAPHLIRYFDCPELIGRAARIAVALLSAAEVEKRRDFSLRELRNIAEKIRGDRSFGACEIGLFKAAGILAWLPGSPNTHGVYRLLDTALIELLPPKPTAVRLELMRLSTPSCE